jgi:hypothetical protein
VTVRLRDRLLFRCSSDRCLVRNLLWILCKALICKSFIFTHGIGPNLLRSVLLQNLFYCSPLPSYLQAQLDETYTASTLVFPSNGNNANGSDGNVFFQGKLLSQSVPFYTDNELSNI